MAVVTDGVNIPEDAMIEILARLPVKSLLRFKCVRKSWYSLVKNPSFINKHLKYAASCSNGDTSRTLLKYMNSETVKAHVSFLLNEATVEFTQDMPMPFFDDDDDMHLCYSITFYGPCNGIICVLGQTRDRSYRLSDLIALWNPATREIKHLLYSNVPYSENAELFHVEIGFGFDSKTNDYQVVRILDFLDKQINFVVDPVVEVYNQSADSWRVIDIVVPTTKRCAHAYSTYLNGFYYWWAGDSNGKLLLSFDFANEVFETIPSPDIKKPNIVTLVKFNESIALFVDDSEDYRNPDLDSIGIFVLNGDKKTWAKLFKIPFPCNLAGFLRSGVAILINSGNNGCQLVSYDPSTQELKILRECDPNHSCTCQLVNYVESLVSFNEAYQLV